MFLPPHDIALHEPAPYSTQEEVKPVSLGMFS